MEHPFAGDTWGRHGEPGGSEQDLAHSGRPGSKAPEASPIPDPGAGPCLAPCPLRAPRGAHEPSPGPAQVRCLPGSCREQKARQRWQSCYTLTGTAAAPSFCPGTIPGPGLPWLMCNPRARCSFPPGCPSS